jgi:glycine cleavage system pyridoxal-binding protein P
VSLLTGLALGAAALLLSKPAHADAVAIGPRTAHRRLKVVVARRSDRAAAAAIVETRYATA